MWFGTDQFSAAAKDNIETQVTAVTTLTSKTMESVSRLVDLNMAAARETIAQATEAVQKFLTAKDVKEFIEVSAAQTQPSAQTIFSYGRDLVSITSSTQAEFSKAAEMQLTQATRSMAVLVEDFARNAPPGSENAISLLKTVLGNAHAGYEQFSKTTKQATDTLEESMATAARHFTRPADKNRTGRK